MSSKREQAAQNQHYVPKFILRNVLGDEKNDRVSVFSKRTGKGFVTSIRNIMAERRFHEFAIGEDSLASFEEPMCRIEDVLLPTYRKVIEERRLDLSPEERGNLATFMAFQFVRTRAQREQFVRVEEQLKEHMEKSGGSIEQLEGYEPLTPDLLAYNHIEFMRTAIGEFALHIASKDMLLLSAPEGRSFYLADNPVCLHNSEPSHPLFSNLGLAVQGIEIYLPLTADLMLAAWCPSLLERMRADREKEHSNRKRELLAVVVRGHITAEQMRQQLVLINERLEPVDQLLAHFEAGTPIPMQETSMDHSNSLQMNFAREFIICKRGDFGLARLFVKGFPVTRTKRSLRPCRAESSRRPHSVPCRFLRVHHRESGAGA
jgi:hypothetical protein